LRLTQFWAQVVIFSALIAVLTVTAIPMPVPLSAITLAPFAIFVASVFLGPRVGFWSALIGSSIGGAISSLVGTQLTPTGLFWIFLVGYIVARGPEGLIIGKLRRFHEVGAMVVGTVYETLAFFVIDFFVTAPFIYGLGLLSWASFLYASLDFGTMIDLVYIVPALIALKFLRSRYKVRYYDSPISVTPSQIHQVTSATQ
jgi:uncharacterized membrane protein